MYFTPRIMLSLVIFVSVFAVIYSANNGDSFFGNTQDACSGDMCQVEIGNHNNVIEDEPKESPSPTDQTVTKLADDMSAEINVLITFTNAARNDKLQKKFTLTLSSLCHYSTVPLAIHIIGDEDSQKVASEIIQNNAGEAKYRIVKLDVDQLAKHVDEVVRPMQKHFSYKPGAYYNHALFFLSIAMHKVMPESMHRVIMLDADLKFTDDIRKLHDRFRLFKKDNIIGIGRDMQPVYRHAFWEYRRDHPGTRVGEPGPEGLTGFNSGVLLLDLYAMRKSDLYNSMLNPDNLERLTKEFKFKGHLGDQDFFTLLNMKYEWLFHVLPCVWNRQLCTWWKENGYKDVFHQYFKCEGDIKIWHGNCNTPIP